MNGGVDEDRKYEFGVRIQLLEDYDAVLMQPLPCSLQEEQEDCGRPKEHKRLWHPKIDRCLARLINAAS